MNPKKLLLLTERYGLFGLVALTLGAFVLAWLQAMKGGAGEAVSIWQALLDTVTSDSHAASGWTKKMHVLLTATLGWAAVRVYMATAGFTWDSFVARHLARAHVVIVAGRSDGAADARTSRAASRDDESGADKSALAMDLALSLADRHSVVLCLPKLGRGSPTSLWAAGVTVLKNDFALADVLKAAGVSRAKMLIAMRDDYGDNLVLATAAMSPSLGNTALECKCMIEPLSAKRDFRLEDYLEPQTVPRVRVFNESELIARCILRDHPPDGPVAATSQGVHLLLVGLGSVGQSILLQLARIGHYRSGLKPKVTVIDRNVKANWKRVLEAHPSLEQWLHVQTEETRIEDVGELELEQWLHADRPLTMAYVCTKDEIANLRIARLLLRQLALRERSGGPVAADVVALDPPGGCVLAEFAAHGADKEHFHLFSLVRGGGGGSAASVASSLLSEMDDGYAVRLHDDYCAKDNEKCAKDPTRKKEGANLPWSQLPETYRDANRFSADHLAVKLRSVGRRLAPIGAAAPAPLAPHELEILARMEHKRWWAERSLAGWVYGDPRDDVRKRHPLMRPYDDLAEDDKQKDRDNVMHIIEVVKGSEALLANRSV